MKAKIMTVVGPLGESTAIKVLTYFSIKVG